ncbi:MAG: 50S ribosomal protein L25 [Spirochaetota bacterium]
MADNNIVVKAFKRVPHSSNSTGRLRKEGYIPGVIYGPKLEKNIDVSLLKNEFEKVFFKVGEHTIINLDVDGETYEVLIKDYQIDPMNKKLTHIDMLIISDDIPVKTYVPVNITGIPKGVKSGGILEQFVSYVRVKAYPRSIPHEFIVDVSPLDVGDSFKIRDMDVPEGVTVLNVPHQTIAGIVTSRVAKVGLEAAIGGEGTEEGASEVEVIGEETTAVEG